MCGSLSHTSASLFWEVPPDRKHMAVSSDPLMTGTHWPPAVVCVSLSRGVKHDVNTSGQPVLSGHAKDPGSIWPSWHHLTNRSPQVCPDQTLGGDDWWLYWTFSLAVVMGLIEHKLSWCNQTRSYTIKYIYSKKKYHIKRYNVNVHGILMPLYLTTYFTAYIYLCDIMLIHKSTWTNKINFLL